MTFSIVTAHLVTPLKKKSILIKETHKEVLYLSQTFHSFYLNETLKKIGRTLYENLKII
jgi:hypothetical protein